MRGLVFLIVLIPAFSSAARAQSEIGVHYAAVAQEYPDQTRSGIGAFFVYSLRDNLNWAGVDVGTTFFLDEEVGGTAWQLVAGPRAGIRRGVVGAFGRIRPGFVRFSERFYAPDIVCIAVFPPPESCLAGRTNFALDIGGTVEIDSSPSISVRFDLGDTMTRFRSGSLDGAWRHGLQFVAGVGWRF